MTSVLAPKEAGPPALDDATSAREPAHPVHHAHHLSPSAEGVKRGLHSTFIVSLTFFLLVNLYFSYAPLSFDPYRYIYKGWAWWTFHDMKQKPEFHNVALLGSSLMVSATNGCDANYLKTKLDLTEYHKATYLDTLLTKKFGGRFNTYNLAAPGQMPSDAFLSLKAMVNTTERPDVVIYGLAPRDFIDSTLSSPLDTEPFHYLTRLVNIDDVSQGLFKNPFAKLDYWLQHTSYLYGNGLNFAMATTDCVTAVMDKLAPRPKGGRAFTYWDRIKLLPGYLPGEIKPEAVVCSPISRSQVTFNNNSQEYIERYRRPEPHIYRTQFYFLKQLTDFCKREKIELVLVNMPITRMNICLLKPMWYMNYIQALREFAFYNSIAMFDLNDFNHFQTGDYHDSVHLNGFGGKKLFDDMVLTMSATTRTKTALELAGKSLERQEQVASLDRVGTR